MISTRFTQMFDLDYPLMSAPMAMHSGGRLAAAVSKAGGLGSFGGVHQTKGPDWLRGEVDQIRSETDRPFGIGFITAFLPMFTPLFDAALAAKPDVIAFSFGSPGAYAEKAKTTGARVMCQVQTLEAAREAIDAGADVLVAQGNEAGGHTGTMNLLPFLARVLDAFPDIPVLAAGGIASGRSLAAVLAAGADGAWLGTAFLATPECTEIPDRYKELIVESDGEDTVFTRIFDIVAGLPWPDGIGARVRRNRLVEQWEGREAELPARREELSAAFMAAREKFDPEVIDVNMGQSAAFVTAVRPAAEVLRSICDDAELVLRQRPTELLT